MMNSTPRILVCLTATNKWYGRLIMWATRSKVNHSLVIHEDPFWGKWRATEIDENGPHDKSIARLERIGTTEYWECEESLLKGMRSMAAYVGSASYDWRGLLFGLVRAIILRLFGFEVEHAIHSHGKLFCSEFVAEVIKRSGVPGSENWETASVSPGDLRKFMSASALFKQVGYPGDD